MLCVICGAGRYDKKNERIEWGQKENMEEEYKYEKRIKRIFVRMRSN